MSIRIAGIVAALVACAPADAYAEALRKVPASLNPEKAYVLIEYSSPENHPVVAGLTFARYDTELEDIPGYGRAAERALAKGEDTVEAFRNRPLAKSKTGRLFLLEVDPGTWVVQGWGDTSFSLGSYSFILEAGTITGFGVATGEVDWPEGEGPPDTGDIVKMALLGPLFAKPLEPFPARASFRHRTSTDMPVPAGLPMDRITPVAFAGGARFGNYLGGLVNRIEGVNALGRASDRAIAAPEPAVAAPLPE